MKKEKQVRTAAVLTLKDPGMLTPKGRRDIAAWLRKQASDLMKLGDQYGKTMVARYMYNA